MPLQQLYFSYRLDYCNTSFIFMVLGTTASHLVPVQLPGNCTICVSLYVCSGMLRKCLFDTKKRATGSVGKSGSAADASVSSPEAKKRRVGGSSSEEPASSASVPPFTGAEVLTEVPEE